MTRIDSGSVKGLIALFESKGAEQKGTVSQRPLSPSDQKVDTLVKNTVLNAQEAPKKRFFEGFKPPPPAPSPEEWAQKPLESKDEKSSAWQKTLPSSPKTSNQVTIGQSREQAPAEQANVSSWQKTSPSSTEKTSKVTIGRGRDQSPEQKVNEKITHLWQRTQPNRPTVSANPLPVLSETRNHKHLQTQISQFSMAIKHIKEHRDSKFTISDDGKFSITKRQLGRTSGTSEETKKVLSELRKLGQEVVASNDPELIIRYSLMLKDLRSSSWGKALETNNRAIRADFQGLASFTRAWLEKDAPSGEKIQQALDTIANSNDRQELFQALQTLRQSRLTQSLSENANLEISNNGTKTALAALRRIDGEVMQAQLLGQDPDVEGRNLLLNSAGWVLKGQEFISPIQKSLTQIADMPPEMATAAFKNLANAAVKLATLPKKDLKENNDQGAALQGELERIRDLALESQDLTIQQQGRALEALLKEPPSSEELNTALNNFRTSLQSNDLEGALTQAEILTFMPKAQLSLPIDPSENSPTLRQELERVRDSLPEQSGALQALLEANTEKISDQPVVATIKEGAIDKTNLLQEIRSGSLKGRDRDAMLSALKEDFRAQFETSIASISSKEFNRAAWGKEEANAPNLLRAINSLNAISYEVQTQFLSSSNFDEAKQVMQFYTDLMGQCLEDKNFYGALTIYSALNASPVARFLPVMLDKQQQATFKQTADIFNPQGSFKELREATAKAAEAGHKPIPAFTYLLSDLTFIEDGNPAKIDGKANLEKTDLIQQNIHLFTGYRDALNLRTERNSDFFQEQSTDFFNNGVFDERAAYNKSLALMSRGDLSALKTKLGVSS